VSRTASSRIALRALLLAPVLAALGAPSALAHWTALGAGAGSAATSSLQPATAVSAGSDLVSWTASSTAGAVAPTSYLVERSDVAQPDDGVHSWSSACTSTGVSCTDATRPSTEGTHRFAYRVTARRGIAWTAVSVESAVVTVTIAPTVTVSTPDLSDLSDTGTSATDDITRTTTPTVAGTATEGATVEVLDGTVVVGTGIATEGVYVIQLSALAGGSGTAHVLTARATAGSTTVTSPGGLTVTVDTEAPSVGAVSVGANGSSSNNKPLSGTASTASTHPGALTSVTVTVSGVAAAACVVTPATATVTQATGAWSGPTVALNRGFSCTAAVTQLDAAGNSASGTATVTRS